MRDAPGLIFYSNEQRLLPFLAGPGTIAKAMRFTTRDDYENVGLVVRALALICFVTFFTFCVGENLLNFSGRTPSKS